MKAKFIEEASESQIMWGGCDNPNGLLEVGREYEVIGTAHNQNATLIILGAFPALIFNAANFEVTI